LTKTRMSTSSHCLSVQTGVLTQEDFREEGGTGMSVTSCLVEYIGEFFRGMELFLNGLREKPDHHLQGSAGRMSNILAVCQPPPSRSLPMTFPRGTPHPKALAES